VSLGGWGGGGGGGGGPEKEEQDGEREIKWVRITWQWFPVAGKSNLDYVFFPS